MKAEPVWEILCGKEGGEEGDAIDEEKRGAKDDANCLLNPFLRRVTRGQDLRAFVLRAPSRHLQITISGGVTTSDQGCGSGSDQPILNFSSQGGTFFALNFCLFCLIFHEIIIFLFTDYTITLTGTR